MIIPALDQGKNKWAIQVHVGQRFGHGRHYVDAVAEKNGRKHLISAKRQQLAGTAEQKVPFEVICLVEAIRVQPHIHHNAYVVLGGEGWTLQRSYTSCGLQQYLRNSENVNILTHESFVAKAHQGVL